MAYTEHHLNYSELSPRQFEELCHWLLEAMGHTDVRHWGAAGSEQGCDVVSTDPDGRRWVTQAKRVQSFGKALAIKEVEKVLAAPPTPPPDVYLLAATCDVGRETEEHLVEVIQGKFELKVWGLTEFDKRVREYPQVQARFFGPDEKPRTFWNVPPRNPFFTGREELLEQLKERLSAAKSVALTQAITGLGGIGKTQTAVEFCHRHRADYPFIFWADASSADALRASYAQMAQRLKVAGRETPVEEAAEMFRHWLSERGDWLLVLDNVDAPDEIRPLRPAASSGHLLVTSRDRKIQGFGSDPLGVDVLPLEQATDLLIRRAKRDESARSAAEELAEELGCLPLALEQAGAYVDIHDVSFADYLAAYWKRRLELLDKVAPQVGDYPWTVATTWNLSFQQLEKTAPVAAEVLRVCAFYAPDEIPAEIFRQSAEYLGTAAAKAKAELQDPLTFAELVVVPLQRYSLVTWDHVEGTLSLHRLVQVVLLAQLRASGGWYQALESAHHALEASVPVGDLDDPRAWSGWRRLLPQVGSIGEYWRDLRPIASGFDPGVLLQQGALFAAATGRFAVEQWLAERAYEVRRVLLGDEHADTLGALSNLALAYFNAGKLESACELHVKTFQDRCRVLGEEHEDTLASGNNLGMTLHALGHLQRALGILARVLEISLRVLGVEHRITLGTRNNLANSLLTSQDFEGARQLYEENAKLYGSILGNEHPETLRSYFNLALTVHGLRDFEGARQLHEANLGACRRVLGDENPLTLRSMHGLALILQQLGCLDQRKSLLEELLDGVANLPQGHELREVVLQQWRS